jgi:hypothetical protein
MLLGHNPNEPWENLKDPYVKAIYEEVQRYATEMRRRALAQYALDRMGPSATLVGVFPPICVAMIEPQEFSSLLEPAGQYGMGYLKVDTSKPGNCIAVDGLGRVGGIDYLTHVLKADPNSLFTLGVQVFAPAPGARLTVQDIGQIFHDLNFLGQPITARHALALDQRSNLYAKLTDELSKLPAVKDHGGMEKRAGSIGKKSSALVVQQVLMRFVRGACEGAKFQEANRESLEHPNLTEATYSQILANLENFLSGIAKRMGAPRFTEHNSLARTSPGWQALGLIFHDFTYRLDDAAATPLVYNQILDAIAGVDWSRHNPEWIGLLGDAELDKRTGVSVVDAQGRPRVALDKAGRTNRATLHAYLQKKTGIDKLLAVQVATVAA